MFTLSEYKKYKAHESKFQENLLDLVKSADIETIWIGNNSSCKHVCDRVKTIDYVDKDSEDYIGYGALDEVVIEGLKKVFEKLKGNTEELFKVISKHQTDIQKILKRLDLAILPVSNYDLYLRQDACEFYEDFVDVMNKLDGENGKSKRLNKKNKKN
jgi:hypothetical protein